MHLNACSAGSGRKNNCPGTKALLVSLWVRDTEGHGEQENTHMKLSSKGSIKESARELETGGGPYWDGEPR